MTPFARYASLVMTIPLRLHDEDKPKVIPSWKCLECGGWFQREPRPSRTPKYCCHDCANTANNRLQSSRLRRVVRGARI